MYVTHRYRVIAVYGDVYGTFTKSIGVSLLTLGIVVDWFPSSL